MLIFFSATGLLLNHPEWLQGTPDPAETVFQLTPDQIADLRASASPPSALAKLAGTEVDLAGAYRSGEVVGEDVYANLQGVRGRSDVTASLVSGEVRVHVERDGAVGILNALHRGEHAGKVWRLIIDVTAILLIVMSLVGFLIFLSLRRRWRTALTLVAVSLLLVLGVFLFATA